MSLAWKILYAFFIVYVFKHISVLFYASCFLSFLHPVLRRNLGRMMDWKLERGRVWKKPRGGTCTITWYNSFCSNSLILPSIFSYKQLQFASLFSSLFLPLGYQKPSPFEIGRFMEVFKLAVLELKTVETTTRVCRWC